MRSRRMLRLLHRKRNPKCGAERSVAMSDGSLSESMVDEILRHSRTQFSEPEDTSRLALCRIHANREDDVRQWFGEFNNDPQLHQYLAAWLDSGGVPGFGRVLPEPLVFCQFNRPGVEIKKRSPRNSIRWLWLRVAHWSSGRVEAQCTNVRRVDELKHMLRPAQNSNNFWRLFKQVPEIFTFDENRCATNAIKMKIGRNSINSSKL